MNEHRYEDCYYEEGLIESVENDEMTSEEEGFMLGYISA